MPEYLAPGVFVEEIDSGSKPIEGVGINTAAFIGYAKSGDFNKPTFITNWTQFCQQFGEEENAVLGALCDELKMSVSEVYTAKKASRKGWMEYANQAVLRAIQGGTASVKSWQEFVRKYKISQASLPYLEGSYLAHAVRGYYDNGGGRAYIIRVARPEDIKALSGNGSAKASQPAEQRAQIEVGPLLLTAAKAGAAGDEIQVEVEHVGDGAEFKVKISQGGTTENIPDGKDKPLTPDTAAAAINKASKLVRAEAPKEVATAIRPEAKTFVLAGGAENLPAKAGSQALAPAGSPLSNGLATVRADDFIGDEAQRTGLSGLFAVEGINFVAIPDLMSGLWKREEIPGVGPEDSVGPEELVLDNRRRQAILDMQCALVGHCERVGYRMAIIDPLPGLTPLEMNNTTMNTPYNCDHGQGAIYYPWIKISDPFHKGQQMFCPPSGHVAGVWTRVGVERGVHKAPANEALIGAVALEVEVTKGEQELLNPNGINCIRAFPGRGIRVWGARTLATVGNPSWKYINVRRLFNYLEESMERSLQWVVFEPNDQDLWGRVRRNIAAFLFTEWKEGKLFGAVPQEAFYVKCDSETNPQEMIDLGRLYVEIGVNPVKPAEFVIIRIGQWSGSSSLSEV
ncbi:MAG TPA: phage tail sheath subtilisin-like domain-containing protein [Capsulimonadaceae bacterium]|nr:phage tail sheath subtilisin-like domain-containing protein [Capsulimonadaceae bacterium]